MHLKKSINLGQFVQFIHGDLYQNLFVQGNLLTCCFYHDKDGLTVKKVDLPLLFFCIFVQYRNMLPNFDI